MLPPSVIRFYQAERNIAAKIHRTISRVYGKNFSSDSVLLEWCRKFKNGQTDVHDEEEQGRKSVSTEDLVQRAPGSFWSSLNGKCLITCRIAPT
ncbi:hypothetical protein AVEN_225761-1 [Araneus ventricosus]|uniref:Mos1 transposase HTH domain-containing protein n=1 Tax=Araneus ventricosus TaxID=182803 RepID=A0A4Y2N8V6_ARAVE|nr:hypothetical protein AVEN_225761-1 [Araneus ventricosus]